MSLVPRSDFIGLDDVAHLATGGQPPLLRAHRDAFEAFARDRAGGMAGYEHHWDVGHAVKQRLAAMTGLEPEDFALLGNASEGIGRVVSSMGWAPGNNAVVSAVDYASGRFALVRLEALQVDVRQVPPEGWFIDSDALLAACDDHTRLVYVSVINAHTGQRVALEALSKGLRERGIALLIDASHALGVIPVAGDLADFMVCSTYKFLLSPHSGILAWNRRRWPNFQPMAVGWRAARDDGAGRYELKSDAARAEVGNANHLAVYLLRTSLDYLAQVPGPALEDHVLALGGRIREACVTLGVHLMTPEAGQDRGPNICFVHRDARRFVDRAREHGILLWAGPDRVRASLHLFSGPDDVDRLLDWLPQGLAEIPAG